MQVVMLKAVVVIGLFFAFVLAGCRTSSPANDPAVASEFMPFVGQGPYEVGLAALYIGNQQVSMHPGPFARAVDVWYPIQQGAAIDRQLAAYDLVSWFPASIAVDAKLMDALFSDDNRAPRRSPLTRRNGIR